MPTVIHETLRRRIVFGAGALAELPGELAPSSSGARS